MIDTITIILKRSDSQGHWNLNTITQRLDTDSLTTTRKGDSIFVNGYIKNMKVRVSNDLIKIHGSLTKYFFGNNLQTLDSDDIVTAIVWLGEDLKLPIERGYIKRIDVARNIIVHKQVKKYLDCFDETPGYHRDRITDRLLYKKSNGTFSVTFYDKVQELKKNDRALYQYNRDGYLKGKNILRYEVKLEQKINKLLKYQSVRVVHLRSTTFLKKLHDFWYSKYKTILTKKNFTFGNDLNSYTDFKKELLVKAIHDIGVTNLYKMIEDLRKSGKLTSNQKAYAKQDINKLVSESSSLIELDHNVELMTGVDFLHNDVDEDVFTHLKKILVKKDYQEKPNKYLYTDVTEELSKMNEIKRHDLKDADNSQKGYLWDLPEID